MMNKSYTSNHAGRWLGQFGHKMNVFVATLAMVLFLGSQDGWAQGRTVTGRVTDATSSGLPGVSVQVKGTQRGTNTDSDGKYSLSNVGDNATLVLSFIGYTSQEIVVGNRSSIDVKLADDTKALEEVVVVGYGTAKKKDLTGSVTQVSTKDFENSVKGCQTMLSS